MANMIGKDALIKLLGHEGVEYVFGIPGATEILFMDALEENPDIQYILGPTLKSALDSREPNLIEVFVENRP